MHFCLCNITIHLVILLYLSIEPLRLKLLECICNTNITHFV